MPPRQVRLGKLPPAHDPRTLCMANFLDMALLPTPPASVNYGAAIKDWKMLGNDHWGDCAVVAPAHGIMAMTDSAGHPFEPSEKAVLEVYHKISPDDQGCVMLDVFRWWKTNGIDGHKISGYVQVDPKNIKEIKTACWLFGGVYLGFSLPESCQRQKTWSCPNWYQRFLPAYARGSWGGHATYHRGYRDTVPAITWGYEQPITNCFFTSYADEAWAVVTDDFFTDKGISVSGLLKQKLWDALEQVSRWPVQRLVGDS